MAPWLLIVAPWLLIMAPWLLIVAPWLLIVASCLLIVSSWLLIVAPWLLVVASWLLTFCRNFLILKYKVNNKHTLVEKSSSILYTWINTIRHNKKDGGMSISKTFFFKLKSVAKTLKYI